MMNQIEVGQKFAVPDAALIEKYAQKKGSFYSYYPMNGLWSEDVGAANYSDAIDQLIETDPNRPVALYLHFPFCATQCLFCHCFTIISKSDDDHSRVVDYLIKELELLKRLFDKKGFHPNIKEIHFGGGSPSNMSRKNFSRLFAAIRSLTEDTDYLECALEIDPRYNVDREQLHYYADEGVNRISFGIQDFDPKIGKIINRVNSPEKIEDLLAGDVRARFESVNFDLIYGMPEQTLDGWLSTIDRAVTLSPDRLAVYVWGFRPDLYPFMKALEKYDRAGPQMQMEMFVGAVNKFIDNGYEFLGIDHMAKPTDVLSVAKKEGKLDRNAIGYSPGRARDVIAVGPNAMSSVGDHYFQNFHAMGKYYGAVDSGNLPLVRGITANADDLVRRDVIFKIILNSCVAFQDIEEAHNIQNFGDYFKIEMDGLKELVDDGLLVVSGEGLALTPTGRFFQRHVCRVFDRYDREVGYRYSREFEDGKAGFDRRAQLSS